MTDGARSKLRPAALGGLALGAASAFPIVNIANCACCSLVVLGGFLAAHLYLKSMPPTAEPPWGDVAIVGLLAGLIGAVVNAVLSVPLALVGWSMGMWTAMQQAMQEAGMPEELQNLFATLGSGTLAIGFILLTMVLNLFVYGAFAAGGALLGAAVLRRRSTTTGTVA